MTEHTEQSPAPQPEVPASVDLEDVIEVIARGAARAWTASEDVSGYAAPRPYYFGVALNSWFIPLGPPQRPGGQQ